jgi:thiol-disulfide isomerase/thioredoxin
MFGWLKGIAQGAREFLGVRFNLYLVLALLVLGALVYFSVPQQAVDTGESSGLNLTVHFFFLPTCPHCHEQRPIIEELQAEYHEVHFAYHDISLPDELMFFTQLGQEKGFQTGGVPVTVVGNLSFIGFHPKGELEAALNSCIQQCAVQQQSNNTGIDLSRYELPFIGKANLREYSLPVLAAVLGLIDGFNPCAMWVLVYMIAVIAELKDKRRIWLIVGSFLFASGALYFLFMTAWLNAFLLIGYMRPVTIIVGIVALGGGILSVKEYIESKGRVECKVGDVESKKSTMKRINDLAGAPLTIATVLGVIALAFVVNSIEFVCSAAIPAVFTQVLSLSHLSALEYYGYILLYDFFFMFDDLIIFSMAAFAISGGMGEKYASISKVLGGLILVLLGVMLLFAPHLLG